MSKNDLEIARLAGQHAGVIATWLAEAHGIGESAILRRARRGSLFRVFDGVYLVGHAALTAERVWWASILYARDACALSRRSGLEARTLVSDARPWDVTVAVPTRARAVMGHLPYGDRPITLTLHESTALPRRTVRAPFASNLPILAVSDLLVDAAWYASDDFGPALRNAEFRRLVKDRDLKRVLRMGRNGSAAVREVLEQRGVGVRRTQNELEDLGYELAVALGMPLPETNVQIITPEGPIRVDLYFRALGLVIELDGGDAHGTVGGMVRDRSNDAALRAVGLDVMRFTWWQVTRQRQQVAAALRGAGYLA